jgi:hypothetical protein
MFIHTDSSYKKFPSCQEFDLNFHYSSFVKRTLFQEAGKKGKKKTKASRSNLNHLLGFSVQGQGVNRGELDVPQ